MNTPNTVPVAASCPYAADALAHALNADNCLDSVVTAHVASCPVCCGEGAAARETIVRLRTLPEVEPSPDLTQRILSALPSAEPRTLFIRLRPVLAAAAAAVVALIAGLFWLGSDHTDSRGALVSGRWLLRTQQADGLWQPARVTGGDSHGYATALTALAALALEQRDSDQNRSAVDRAIAALLAGQQPDGTFGPTGHCRAYNHSMATASLLAIRQLRPQALPEAPLQRAVARIRANQDAAGAWGYEIDDPPNMALTVWQTDALLRAQASGWGDPEGHLRKAIRWLRAQQQAGSGHFAYDRTPGTPTATLDAMGVAILLEAQLTPSDRQALVSQTEQALQTVVNESGADFYRDYFAVRALDAVGDNALAANIRDRVAAQQAASGAWDTADRWTPIGGQLYATVIALLTVE